jgi:hypothetical protein
MFRFIFSCIYINIYIYIYSVIYMEYILIVQKIKHAPLRMKCVKMQKNCAEPKRMHEIQHRLGRDSLPK